MSESPTGLSLKPQGEAFSSMGSGISAPRSSSPLTNSEQESRTTRVNYQIHQPGPQSRKIFGFEIFVDNDVLMQLQPQSEWFQKVKKAGQVESMKFNLDLNIPDLNGRNIQIYDKEMERKYQSCRVLLADIYQVFKRIRREHFAIIIFVPEGMVSLLIGTKGYQINKIMRESHTIIVVNQPINKMTYRTVKIQGYHTDIAKACRIIYEILEDKSSIAYSIEKEPSQLDYSKARVKTKFILGSSILNYLLGKKKEVIKKVQEETKCLIKFKEDTSCRQLKREEELCVLLGKLEDVQTFIVMLINIIQLYHDEDRKGYDYTFKMLIPSNYVTKLIGQKGYMIRDITQRSGGAKIKIQSDRQSERDAKQCIISIDGTRENKIDAICLILQQIECFKNGGPILQSGKSINQNLAEQFKNSLPLHQGEEMVNETPERQEEKPKEEEIVHRQSDQSNIDEEGQISEEEEGEEVESSPKEAGVEQPSQVAAKQPSKERTEGETELRVKEKVEEKKVARSPSEHSQASNSSASRSRKKQAKGNCSSSSSSYKQDKQHVEVKLVVPRKLAQDHKQLRYIQDLSHSQISSRDQRFESRGESIIIVKGSLKNNIQCIKLLQKRIWKLVTSNR